MINSSETNDAQRRYVVYACPPEPDSWGNRVWRIKIDGAPLSPDLYFVQDLDARAYAEMLAALEGST